MGAVAAFVTWWAHSRALRTVEVTWQTVLNAASSSGLIGLRRRLRESEIPDSSSGYSTSRMIP